MDDLQSQLGNILFALDRSAIVAITDINGIVKYVNDKFCEISKYDKSDLIGKNFRILKSGYHSKEFYEDIWSKVSSGKVWHGEIKNKAKDGALYWVDATIVPLLKNGKPVEYITIRKDITERKLAIEKLESERAKAHYVEKMASLGELSAGIAHEIGNPLGALRGRVEMLETQVKNNDLSKDVLLEFCDRVLKIIDKTSKIIRGLRSYSRDGSHDPFVKTSVTEIIKDIMEFSSSRIKKQSVNIIAEGLNQDHFIECRESEIGQVIVNLINNSCDAIRDLPDKWIKIDLSDSNGDVIIKITDSGKGIPLEIQQKIFQPFFTTKDIGSGTGLGLSIVTTIVHAHRGSIRVNPDSENTQFIISLPRIH